VKYASPALAFLLMASISVPATALTGTQLYKSCLTTTGPGAVMCTVYVRGFVDGFLMGKLVGQENPPLYCPPDAGVDAQQARLIVRKFLSNHPEKLHEEASFVTSEALMTAFPCSTKSK
jgi:hypothetical protein